MAGSSLKTFILAGVIASLGIATALLIPYFTDVFLPQFRTMGLLSMVATFLFFFWLRQSGRKWLWLTAILRPNPPEGERLRDHWWEWPLFVLAFLAALIVTWKITGKAFLEYTA